MLARAVGRFSPRGRRSRPLLGSVVQPSTPADKSTPTSRTKPLPSIADVLVLLDSVPTGVSPSAGPATQSRQGLIRPSQRRVRHLDDPQQYSERKRKHQRKYEWEWESDEREQVEREDQQQQRPRDNQPEQWRRGFSPRPVAARTTA